MLIIPKIHDICDIFGRYHIKTLLPQQKNGLPPPGAETARVEGTPLFTGFSSPFLIQCVSSTTISIPDRENLRVSNEPYTDKETVRRVELARKRPSFDLDVYGECHDSNISFGAVQTPCVCEPVGMDHASGPNLRQFEKLELSIKSILCIQNIFLIFASIRI